MACHHLPGRAPCCTSAELSLIGTNMKSLHQVLLATVLLVGLRAVQAANINVDLQPDKANPSNPTMGNWMHFHSEIHNSGAKPVEGLVAWISLVEVTSGHEQPMDLEDWSAYKAVPGTTLAPGASLTTDWPMRLIQSGDYRVVICVTDRNEQKVYTSPTLQFHIELRPVVEASRILPVALGVPLGMGVVMGYLGWHRRRLGRTS
jgi:hypothetical protein